MPAFFRYTADTCTVEVFKQFLHWAAMQMLSDKRSEHWIFARYTIYRDCVQTSRYTFNDFRGPQGDETPPFSEVRLSLR